MKIIRKYDDYLKKYDYLFEEGNSTLLIRYGNNLDLFFVLHSNGIDIKSNNCFNITKEKTYIYNLFEKLYSDIENINLFDNITEDEKDDYRLFDKANYNKLYNPYTNTITWVSDETAFEVANYFKIIKEDEKFKLEFFTKPPIKGYDIDCYTKYIIPVRLRNSGSRYYPFNQIFMNLYIELQKYNPDYHQITIEEYNENIKRLVNK